MRNIRQIQFRIYAMREHIHGKCDNVDITGTLTISKQSTLDTVCTS